MYKLTPADVCMAFEKDTHWYRNVNWITYVKADHSIKLGSPNSNKIFPFTLFSKGEGERPPDSTSSKMILWAPQKKIRVNDKKLEQIVMISLNITIMLYLATSRHENLQLDPSCPPLTWVKRSELKKPARKKSEQERSTTGSRSRVRITCHMSLVRCHTAITE
jgi:hypothetical protein